jgi:hypothetical protein
MNDRLPPHAAVSEQTTAQSLEPRYRAIRAATEAARGPPSAAD